MSIVAARSTARRGALYRRGMTEDTRRVWLARLKWLVES
jgi:hypothetical protein